MFIVAISGQIMNYLDHILGPLAPDARCLNANTPDALRLNANAAPTSLTAIFSCAVETSAFCAGGVQQTRVCRAAFGGFNSLFSRISCANAVPNTPLGLIY